MRRPLPRDRADEIPGLSRRASRGESNADPQSVGLIGQLAGGWLGYLLEGLTLLSRAPALAVMEYRPGELM